MLTTDMAFSILVYMDPVLSIVLLLPPSTAYGQLESVAKNLLDGMSKMLESGKVRFSIFMDGPTLEAASKAARPLMFGRFRKAIEEGFLEILGGGYHDPMLPLFPSELQAMQLEEHRKLLWKHFGIEPNGYFNSSMVWEMEMTELLEKNRFDYALVQESALQDALGRTTPIAGWYSVEDKGSFLRVVPVSENLSRAIANDDFQWQEIAKHYCRDGRSAVVALDVPPQPGDIVPFFERLVDFVETNDLATKTVSCAVNEQLPEGQLSFLLSAGRRIGLPSTAKTCRELLIRRPEVNLLHKSLMTLYRRARSNLKDKQLLEFYKKLLPTMSPIYYRDMPDSEGMRTPFVRWWGFRFLIQAASNLAAKVSFDGIRLEISDYMLDGRKHILAENHSYSFLLDYSSGGSLKMMNGKDSEVNLLGAWRDDGDPTVGFMDFLVPNTDLSPAKLDQLLTDREHILCAGYDYEINRHEKGTDIFLRSEQDVVLVEQKKKVAIEKKYKLSSSGSYFVLDFKITNTLGEFLEKFFGTLLETGLQACCKQQDGIYVNKKKLAFDYRNALIYPDAKTLEIVDWTTSCHVGFKFSEPTALLISPMYSASASAAPEEFQGLRFFPFWKIKLDSGAEKRLRVSVHFSRR